MNDFRKEVLNKFEAISLLESQKNETMVMQLKQRVQELEDYIERVLLKKVITKSGGQGGDEQIMKYPIQNLRDEFNVKMASIVEEMGNMVSLEDFDRQISKISILVSQMNSSSSGTGKFQPRSDVINQKIGILEQKYSYMKSILDNAISTDNYQQSLQLEDFNNDLQEQPGSVPERFISLDEEKTVSYSNREVNNQRNYLKSTHDEDIMMSARFGSIEEPQDNGMFGSNKTLKIKQLLQTVQGNKKSKKTRGKSKSLQKSKNKERRERKKIKKEKNLMKAKY